MTFSFLNNLAPVFFFSSQSFFYISVINQSFFLSMHGKTYRTEFWQISRVFLKADVALQYK